MWYPAAGHQDLGRRERPHHRRDRGLPQGHQGRQVHPLDRAFSFPMAVLCILGFVNVGNINYGLRLAYMFITYVLYEALYTCVNVPFGTLSSVMTDDVSQRTALSRYRSLGGTIS